MLKKIFVSELLLTMAFTSAYAINYKNETDALSRKSYKGEISPPSAPIIPSVPDFIPCKTYTFAPGPYIGLNAGFLTNYNQTSSVFKAFEGTLFAGYALINYNFYLGAELFGERSARLQNYQNNLNANLNPIGVQTTWGGGLSLLPGFIVADTVLGYFRIAALIVHFEDVAQTTSGGQVGFGLQSSITSCWDLRAEYTYTFYQSPSGLGNPRSDAFRLGLVYKFSS